MHELGIPVTPPAVAEHYLGVIDSLLVDERDPSCDLSVPHLTCNTLMTSLADRCRVAEAVLELARRVDTILAPMRLLPAILRSLCSGSVREASSRIAQRPGPMCAAWIGRVRPTMSICQKMFRRGGCNCPQRGTCPEL